MFSIGTSSHCSELVHFPIIAPGNNPAIPPKKVVPAKIANPDGQFP